LVRVLTRHRSTPPRSRIRTCCAREPSSSARIDCQDDARANAALPGGYEVFIHGGRTPTGIDALEWAQRGVELGAGEILLTSMDRDGTKLGYDLLLTAKIAGAVTVPVIASGGVGTLEHFYTGLTTGGADAALAASIFHFGEYRVRDVKHYLQDRGVVIRPS